MDTDIGAGLRDRPARVRWGLAIAVVALLADGLGIRYVDAYSFSLGRIALGVVAVAILAVLCGGAAGVGFTWRASPSWGHWPRWVLRVLLVVLALVALFAILVLAGAVEFEMKPHFRSKAVLWDHLPNMVLHAPVAEELLYRVVLCVPCAALLGPRWTIVVSGLVFAALHWLYGNPGADNQVAGFLLGYAYLRSGNLFLPVLLHALGNGVAFTANAVLFEVVGGR